VRAAVEQFFRWTMCAAAFRQQTLWLVHRGQSTARMQELVNYQTSEEA